MATAEFWIQIENNPWDVAPRNIDRLTGQTMQQITGQAPVVKTLVSPVTGVVKTRTMFRPLSQDTLILRHYTPNWAAPDDRKVNPWDLNEPDPTDNGTMGTIPDAVIECTVGDKVIVHFRNQDTRSGKALKARTHSLRPHGFVFVPTSDGALERRALRHTTYLASALHLIYRICATIRTRLRPLLPPTLLLSLRGTRRFECLPVSAG